MHLPSPPPTTRRPATETILPAAETIARAPSHAIDAFAGQPPARRLPLRFTWQMDREGRFTLGAGEFAGLIGPRTMAAFGRPWREIAETFGFDPTGRMMQAFATGATWSGITLNWPVDGGGTLPVELSGLPIFDAARNFIGYRGFGVCRDFDAIARLAALRLAELSGEIVTPQTRAGCAVCRAGRRRIASIRRIARTDCRRRLPLPRLLLRLQLQMIHIKKIWKSPWNLPSKAQRKAPRKASRKASRECAGGNRNGAASRHCRKRPAVPRPGRSQAAVADAG